MNMWAAVSWESRILKLLKPSMKEMETFRQRKKKPTLRVYMYNPSKMCLNICWSEYSSVILETVEVDPEPVYSGHSFFGTTMLWVGRHSITGHQVHPYFDLGKFRVANPWSKLKVCLS